MQIPETKYARSADVTFIAYSVAGDGPVDIVAVFGYTTHIEMLWGHPIPATTMSALASAGRLITFDKRGCGLSDRVSPLTDLDTRAQDLLAVMDAAGSQRAVLVGEHEGGALAAFVAATYPERVHALVWWGGVAKNAWAPDNPDGTTEQQEAASLAAIEEGWGTVDFVRKFMQEDASGALTEDPELLEFMARWFRYSASPGEAMRFDRM